jgi:ABC-type bacteriocin/lantibiotic exporter with double-glycine peptidase domain
LYSISINISSELFTKHSFNRDLKRFEDGISEKLGFAIYYSSGSVVNLILAFIFGWKLALVVLAFAPLLAISTGIMTKVSETQFVS